MNKSFYLRHEDFNWSIFDLEQFLLEHSDLGYSSFLYEDPCYVFLIETVKKFSNVFGYQEPADLSTRGQHAHHAWNLTVY